jgi:hypothetical protein
MNVLDFAKGGGKIFSRRAARAGETGIFSSERWVGLLREIADVLVEMDPSRRRSPGAPRRDGSITS